MYLLLFTLYPHKTLRSFNITMHNIHTSIILLLFFYILFLLKKKRKYKNKYFFLSQHNTLFVFYCLFYYLRILFSGENNNRHTRTKMSIHIYVVRTHAGIKKRLYFVIILPFQINFRRNYW